MNRSNTRALGVGRRAALAGGASLLAFPAIHAEAQTAGVALVVGNSRYRWEAPLPNVRRDAPDVARRFQSLGLKTELVQDAGGDAMRKAIASFMASARGANFAALYFAGHGAAWGKETYLVPVDADLSNPNVDTLIQVNSFREGMGQARARLVVLDNCRNNPADGWAQRETADAAGIREDRDMGLPNSLVLYSTAPGRTALDGPPGENSPFAATLLRELDAPSVDLQALPGKLRRDLLIATQGRQVLFDRNSFQQPFYLRGAGGSAGAAGARGGWANDPSKIIELPGAYNFARQQNLTLPPGLIAHRPPAGSPHAQKIGSFAFEMAQPSGGLAPALVVVMSAEEGDSAEVIFLVRGNARTGWRFVRGTLGANGMNVVTRENGPSLDFQWRDASSGNITQHAPQQRGARTVHNGRFTRLDG
jgi:hypothetical protein